MTRSYSHGFLYPSTVSDIRAETPTGLAVSATSARGGSDGVDAYSTVSRFGISYKPPSSDMSATEEVEALVEGSPLSLLSANTSYSRSPGHAKHQAFSKVESIRHGIHRTFASRPSRTERFLGDPEEGGGTVVVHYIKKPDWFVETMIAFLGTAEEQGPSRRGLGTGVGSMGAKRGRVAGVGEFGGGVRVVKDAGL